MCRVSRIAFGALIFTIKSVSMRGGRNVESTSVSLDKG